jgi:hypothetical protein
MSDTTAIPGSSRKSPRKARIAGLAGLIAVAGTVAAIAVPAAASASTVATTPNPTCAIPAGATYNLIVRDHIPLFPGDALGLVTSEWEAFSNGVYYNGLAVGINFVGNPIQAVADHAAGLAVEAICSTSSSPLYTS